MKQTGREIKMDIFITVHLCVEVAVMLELFEFEIEIGIFSLQLVNLFLHFLFRP